MPWESDAANPCGKERFKAVMALAQRQDPAAAQVLEMFKKNQCSSKDKMPKQCYCIEYGKKSSVLELKG